MQVRELPLRRSGDPNVIVVAAVVAAILWLALTRLERRIAEPQWTVAAIDTLPALNDDLNGPLSPDTSARRR